MHAAPHRARLTAVATVLAAETFDALDPDRVERPPCRIPPFPDPYPPDCSLRPLWCCCRWGCSASPPPGRPAPPPPGTGTFSSSFEPADPQPATSTVEVDASGKPVQANLSGSSPTGLPGSLPGQGSAATDRADEPP